MVAITSFNRDHIFEAVKKMYTEVANKPEVEYHFPTGRGACEFLGYPAEQLDAIPSTSYESFAGVGYPFKGGMIKPGDTVLDIGAGAGTDALIASLITGDQGKVYGLDMTQAMQDKLKANIEKLGISHVETLSGNAEEIPLEDETVDVITSNGVLNLVPDKQTAFNEIYRVLKKGGRLQISDIVVTKGEDKLEESKKNPGLWAECIAGALHEDTYLNALRSAGMEEVTVIGRVDYFSHSSSEPTRKIAKHFEAGSITFTGLKK